MLDDGEVLGLVGLTTYLRMYSLMINAGVSLMRCMSVLDQTLTPGPLREANARIMQAVEGGSTLSEAMLGFPRLFTPFLIGMVRAGEVGGVLDVTMQHAADFYQQQLDNRRERCTLFATARMLGGTEQESRYRNALKEMEDKFLIQYFCWMFGTMLGAGVPILHALEVAADILIGLRADECKKARLAAALRQAADAVRAQQSVVPALADAGLPACVIQTFGIGEEHGCLDRMALVAGDLLEAEIRGRMETELGLNYV